MRRFSFRFKTLLTVRKAKEHRSLKELALAQQEYRDELDRKSGLQQDQQRAFHLHRGLENQSVGVSEYYVIDQFIQGNKQRIYKQEQQIHRAGKKIDQKLHTYLNNKKSTKTIELIEQKQLEQHKKSQRHQEILLENDRSSIRSARNSGGSTS